MAGSPRDFAPDGGIGETPEAERVSGRLGDNPFYVLGLRPGCGRGEIEREGQKLLAMLELGLSKAERYASPVGERTRTADKVRQAMAELRDPDRRIVHELWARLPAEPIAHTIVERVPDPARDEAAAGDAESPAGRVESHEVDGRDADVDDARSNAERAFFYDDGAVEDRLSPWVDARRAVGWERRR